MYTKTAATKPIRKPTHWGMTTLPELPTKPLIKDTKNIPVTIRAIVRSMDVSDLTRLIKRQVTRPRIAENPGEYPVSIKMVMEIRGRV